MRNISKQAILKPGDAEVSNGRMFLKYEYVINELYLRYKDTINKLKTKLFKGVAIFFAV